MFVPRSIRKQQTQSFTRVRVQLREGHFHNAGIRDPRAAADLVRTDARRHLALHGPLLPGALPLPQAAAP